MTTPNKDGAPGMPERMENLAEAVISLAENAHHYYENSCLPTDDEMRQAYSAADDARAFLAQPRELPGAREAADAYQDELVNESTRPPSEREWDALVGRKGFLAGVEWALKAMAEGKGEGGK